MNISVILPAYNEEESVREIVEGIYKVLGDDIEIIVVDDCSTDKTSKIAKECGAKVISNPYNMGNGASVKRGIRAAINDTIVLMDADGQHKPCEISKLIEHIDKFDMVIGQRCKGSQVWYRALANGIYNNLASYVSSTKIKDLTSGFRVFKKNKAKEFLHLLPNTFSYPTTLTLSFIKAAYSVKFSEVDVIARKKGKSKINILSDGSRFFIIIMKVGIFFYPLKTFLPVSIFFFLSGLLYYFYTFLNFHTFTNMSALLFTTSVIIFMLGFISEQIANLRAEKVDG